MMTAYDQMTLATQEYLKAEKLLNRLRATTVENIKGIMQNIRTEYNADKLFNKKYMFNRPRKWGYREDLHSTDIFVFDSSRISNVMDQEGKLIQYFSHLYVLNFEQLMNFFTKIDEEKLKVGAVTPKVFDEMFPKDGMFLVACSQNDNYDFDNFEPQNYSSYLHPYSDVYEYMVVNLN